MNTIRDFEDMKPTTYSIYQHSKCFVTEGKKNSPKNKNEEPFKWKPKEKKKGKKYKYSLENERRRLLAEVGGFSQQEIKNRYFDAFNTTTQ